MTEFLSRIWLEISSPAEKLVIRKEVDNHRRSFFLTCGVSSIYRCSEELGNEAQKSAARKAQPWSGAHTNAPGLLQGRAVQNIRAVVYFRRA
jgi:hypothetical protein